MALFQAKSLSLFYRELATLLASGMPVVQASASLVDHLPFGAFRTAVWYIQKDLEQGKTLGEALERYPQYFPGWHVGVVKAGEKSGKLADALSMISSQLERNYSDLLKLSVGLAYPALLLVIALLVMPLLPVKSCAMGGCFARTLSAVFFLGIAAAAAAAVLRKPGPRLKAALQSAALSLPLFGRLLRQFAVTRFTRALQSLCAAGVPIMTAWRLAAEASGNEPVARDLLQGLALIEQGGTIASALTRARVFPPYMAGMIATGEKSGSIVKALDTAAAFCEKENEAAIGILVKTVPIIVYILVACVVGSMIISYYSSYFNSILSIQ
ncbi:MAG: type II secretion system F family protein [Deltaproteobacteria bacterium]